MSEGKPKRRWVVWAYMLGVAIAIAISFGVGIATPTSQGDVPRWLSFSVPFATGLAFGAIVPKRSEWAPATLLLATLVGPLAMCAVIAVGTGIDVIADPNPNVDAPLLIQCLVAALMFLPGALIFGSIPALVGTAVTYGLKWAIPSCSSE